MDFLPILQHGEKRLLAVVRQHAKGQDRFLAAVEEVWNIAFQGLTAALVKAVAAGTLAEPETGNDPADPVIAFGRLEAKRHRERGLRYEMFIELLKIFRRAYVALLRERIPDPAGQAEAVGQIHRFFDRIEISFGSAWIREAEAGNQQAMASKNLELMTERDRYVAVFESLPLPILLLYPDRTVQNMNHAAYRLIFGQGSPGAWYYNAENRREPALLTELFPSFFRAIEAFQATGAERCEHHWTAIRDGVPLSFRVAVSRMLDQPGPYAGILVVLDDQTERIHAARERERLLAEISATLTEVKDLSNLLPICAWCKKIRDDQGYWDQLEGYLATHAGIVFTHGVCPECAGKIRSGCPTP